MDTFASPSQGFCASCEGVITGRPVYRTDEAYCCIGCAGRGPCICTYEADLCDGVSGLGLPFAVRSEPSSDAEATRIRVA
jgi:hypothetical protein